MMRTWSRLFLGLMGSCALALPAQNTPPAAPPATPAAHQGIDPQVWPPPTDEPPAAAAPSTAPARKSAPSSPAAASSASGSDGQVHLDVVVTDKAGNAVSGLSERDFTLLDNRQPRAIDSFQALGSSDVQGAPVEVILAIDAVNISFDRVAVSREYIANYLRRDGGRLRHPTTLVWVTDNGLQTQLGPSMDGNALAAQLDATAGQLRILNRDAGDWGAIERFEMSAQMMNQLVSAMGRIPGRKLLIWIGPGWPILDNPEMQMTWKQQQRLFQNMVHLTSELRQEQIQVYSVTEGMPNYYTYLYQGFLKGVKKPSQIYLPNLSLKVMAVWSGGQVQMPSNDMASEIARCVKDADAYYRLSFTPPAADGPDEYHQLQVKIDKPGLKARTSQMYYDQPAQKNAAAGAQPQPAGTRYGHLAEPQ